MHKFILLFISFHYKGKVDDSSEEEIPSPRKAKPSNIPAPPPLPPAEAPVVAKIRSTPRPTNGDQMYGTSKLPLEHLYEDHLN